MGKTLTGVDQLVELFDNGHLNGICLSVAAGILIGSAEEIGIKTEGTPFSRSRISA